MFKLEKLLNKYGIPLKDYKNVKDITFNEELDYFNKIKKTKNKITITGEYSSNEMIFNLRLIIDKKNPDDFLTYIQYVKNNFTSVKVYNRDGKLMLIS